MGILKVAKPIIRRTVEEEMTPVVKQEVVQPVKEKKKKEKPQDLPSDEYQEEIESLEVEVDEFSKIVISVKRGGEFGLPRMDIRHFSTTERFTGFTKKGVNLPLENTYDLIEMLQTALTECEEKGLIE